MECLEKPIWTNYDKKELEQIVIPKPDEQIRTKVLKNWDAVAKPLDGMGEFETLTAQIGAILGTENIDISKKAVIIMCADNGIVKEGVSQSGQEVTVAVAKMMGKRQSSVGRMARMTGADTIPVDIGINCERAIEGVINQKIKRGTENFRNTPAMTEKETVQAIAVGIDMVYSCEKKGYRLLALGEMGIGNTTTSSAIAAALLQCEAEQVTGRGAGLSDTGLLKKKQVIDEAIQHYRLQEKDAFEILATVGGLDIAGLVGVCIGGALCGIPIVLDGIISMVAALVAERMFPGIKEYLIASHRGKEPAVDLLTKELGKQPVINARLALGEGTGAVMMFSLLDIALDIYQSSSTFLEANVKQYERFS